jgi:hypothetical protein
MAIRGARPTATVVKLATGNPGGRKLPIDEPTPGGEPVMPRWLRRQRSIALWDEVLGFAYWLTVADSYKLAMWCDRQADFERSRKKWTVSDRREHRTLGSELGFDPSSRTRMGSPNAKSKQQQDPAAKYFT